MIEWFQEFAAQNQFFSGLAGASVVGGALYWCRELPWRAWNAARWISSYRIEVSNDSDAYNAVLSWATHSLSDRWTNRYFKLTQEDYGTSSFHEDGDAVGWLLSPGLGSHLVFFERRLVVMQREVTNEQHASHSAVREVIKIRMFTFDRSRVLRLVETFRRTRDTSAKTAVYLWHTDYWRLVDRRLPRGLDSIVLPGDVIPQITSDAEAFLSNESWYNERGIPYRRGYLFVGPAGTGKSSTAAALAGHLGLPLYVLNFGSILNDNALIDAVTTVPSRSILLVEDIDAGGPAEKREDRSERSLLTLSALLNVLDGAMAREGRLLVVTANNTTKIDPAVLRPGRIDQRFEFRDLDAEGAATLFIRFFPGEVDLSAGIRANGFDPKPGAAVQATILAHSRDAHRAAEAIRR